MVDKARSKQGTASPLNSRLLVSVNGFMFKLMRRVIMGGRRWGEFSEKLRGKMEFCY